jgi:hypothetical protein
MTATTKNRPRMMDSGDSLLTAYATSQLPNFDIFSAASVRYDDTKGSYKYIIF